MIGFVSIGGAPYTFHKLTLESDKNVCKSINRESNLDITSTRSLRSPFGRSSNPGIYCEIKSGAREGKAFVVEDENIRETSDFVAGRIEQMKGVGEDGRVSVVKQMMKSLSKFINDSGESEVDLKRMLDDELVWDNPLFTANSSEKAISELKKFKNFFLKTRFECTQVAGASESDSSSTCFVSWTISGFWPVPWRPRVVVSGVSRVTVSEKKVSIVRDEWNISPLKLLRQGIPRFGDIIWLYGSPHAEWTTENYKTIRSTSNYRVVEVPSGQEIQAIQPGTMVSDAWFAIPTAPPNAFSGMTKRTENYFTVSPVTVNRRSNSDDYLWSVGVPSVLSNGTCMPNFSDTVSIVKHSGRVIAVSKPFGGLSSSEITYQKAQLLLNELRKSEELQKAFPDCWQDDDAIIKSDRVRLACYNVKASFNTRGQFAFLNFIAYPFQPRRQEIWVFLDSGVEETLPIPENAVNSLPEFNPNNKSGSQNQENTDEEEDEGPLPLEYYP